MAYLVKPFGTGELLARLRAVLRNRADLLGLGDRPLLEAAKRLAADERHATVALLRALSEIVRPAAANLA